MLNMYVFATALGLASAAAAAAAVAPTNPPLTYSKAFNLVVRLTEDSTSKDFASIHNTYVSNIRTGHQGHDLLGPTEDAHKALVFYLNGTTKAPEYYQVLTESTTSSSSGIRLDPDEGKLAVQTAYLVEGASDVGFSVKRPSEHPSEKYAFLQQGAWVATWVACKNYLPLDKDREAILLKQAIFEQLTTGTNRNIPEGCTPVLLVPECTDPSVPDKGSTYASVQFKPSHEHALYSPCYKGARTIE